MHSVVSDRGEVKRGARAIQAQRVGSRAARKAAEAGPWNGKCVVAFAAAQDVRPTVADEYVVPLRPDHDVRSICPLISSESVVSAVTNLGLAAAGEVPAEHHIALALIAVNTGAGVISSDDQIVEAVPIHITGLAHRTAGIIPRRHVLLVYIRPVLSIDAIEPEAVDSAQSRQVQH